MLNTLPMQTWKSWQRDLKCCCLPSWNKGAWRKLQLPKCTAPGLCLAPLLPIKPSSWTPLVQAGSSSIKSQTAPKECTVMVAGRRITYNVLWGPQRYNYCLAGWLFSSRVRTLALWPKRPREREPRPQICLPLLWLMHSLRLEWKNTLWLPTAVSILSLS